MNKVKVWGLEIDSCWKCYHHGRTDFDELCCSYTGTVIKSDINEDCPFSKPVTKEVIEGFGFNPIIPCNIENKEKYDVTHWTMNMYGDGFQILHVYPYEGIYDISYGCNEYNKPLFCGKINNSVELEFILKSIGVIE